MLSPLATGITAVGALGLAAGGFAYAAMVPSSRIFGSALVAPRSPGELALTFDDGPNPACTPRLLDILAEYGAHAAFFMVGSFAAQQPELVRRIHAAGHAIGNHSWSHPNLAITAARRVDEELTRTRDTLQQIIGAPIRYFRPPFGGRRPYVLRAARELGMVPVLWNAMTNDWQEPSPDKIASRLIESIDRLQQRGLAANIVLHDGSHRQQGTDRNPSVNAAKKLLELYAASHHFVTLDAWSESATT
jgi:peptidoglycan/xylan/chitin deacetylase (PgdA/CDA1 family)